MVKAVDKYEKKFYPNSCNPLIQERKRKNLMKLEDNF
jgi:hypothetical protein